MTELLTCAQMREIETAAIESGTTTAAQLMGYAAQGVIDAIHAQWPGFAQADREALVLCGPGNNGGDGFAIALGLREEGWKVRVHFFGDSDKLPAAARAYHDEWLDAGEVLPFDPVTVRKAGRPDLIVDALFGTGLTRPLPQKVREVLAVTGAKRWYAPYDIKTVAVDCPSGLNLDTGRIPQDDGTAGQAGIWEGCGVYPADLTVTFHAPKLGHYLGQGPALCGRLEVANIRLWGPLRDRHALVNERSKLGTPPDPRRVRLVEPVFCLGPVSPPWPDACLGKSQRSGHKYNFGHAVVFAGGVGKGGAARLAARAALRVGAGLVTVVCPPAALIENACQLTAIMLRALGKDQPLNEVADHRVSAFCLGPGLGVSGRTRDLVIEVLGRRAGRDDLRGPAAVLDADALTSFADDPGTLFDHTHERTILTPHDGEFARLFPDLTPEQSPHLSKVDAVRQAAARAGCVVLLKGPDTVIAQQDGGASVHSAAYDRAAPWLATAGAGDVLAGLIAGLAAPDAADSLFCAAELAAYLHVEAARRFGPGLIAEDLPEQLPELFRDWDG